MITYLKRHLFWPTNKAFGWSFFLIVIGYAAAGDMVRFGKIEFTVASFDTNDDESTLSVRGDLLIPDSNGLSPAQYRVFMALLDGFSEKEVATKLDVSRHTVHNHVREIYARFNVTSRAVLMAGNLFARISARRVSSNCALRLFNRLL